MMQSSSARATGSSRTFTPNDPKIAVTTTSTASDAENAIAVPPAAATGNIDSGSATFFTSAALSTTEVVAASTDCVKNVHGRMPESTYSGYFGTASMCRMRRNTNDSTAAWNAGCSTAHSTPSAARL